MKTKHGKMKRHLERMGDHLRLIRKQQEKMFKRFSKDCYFRRKDGDRNDHWCHHPKRRDHRVGVCHWFCRFTVCPYINEGSTKNVKQKSFTHTG